jgi:Uma2 family endonuclease
MAVNVALAPPLTQPTCSESAEPLKSKPSNVVPDDLVLWRLSVKQYHAMARAGSLDEDDPVELLEGLLVDKLTKKPPHTYTSQQTRLALEGIIPPDWFINSQEPITLDTSEPEPDVTIVRGDRRDYLKRHPGPQDVALVVEVADATIKRDRGTKKRIYARAGIPVYWVINLLEQRIEVYTNPSGPTQKPDCLTQQFFYRQDEIPVMLSDQVIGQLQVQELLP